jgi:aryl-alcohol dehydrogenase-like predicted oxidoreductase
MATIGSSGIDVSRLCLGANVFGWTTDEPTSFAVLDAFTGAGGNFVDTSDSYMWRVPGNSGGESETIIGEWFASRGRRDDVVLATKVSSLPARKGLGAANIAAACDDSLRRLQTDHIDLYYAHYDDPSVEQEEYLDAFDKLVRAGKVRAIAASNFTAERLRSALEISARDGLAAFVALQPHYNLVERAEFETSLAPLLESEGLSCVPYYGLAKGFLTGKYRDTEAKGAGASQRAPASEERTTPESRPSGTAPAVDSPRAEGALAYLDDRGRAVLAVLDEIAAGHEVPVAAVALAWLAAQPTVVAPIASARNAEQLADLLPMLDLKLTDDEVRLLAHVSA